MELRVQDTIFLLHVGLFDSSDIKFSLLLPLLDHPWVQNAKKASNVPLGDIVRARLKQFSVMNRFKKRALRVSITYSLS